MEFENEWVLCPSLNEARHGAPCLITQQSMGFDQIIFVAGGAHSDTNAYSCEYLKLVCLFFLKKIKTKYTHTHKYNTKQSKTKQNKTKQNIDRKCGLFISDKHG